MSLRKQIVQKNWPQGEPDTGMLLHLMRLEILEQLKKVVRGEITSYVGFIDYVKELEDVEKEHMAAVCDTDVANITATDEEPKKRGRKKLNPDDF